MKLQKEKLNQIDDQLEQLLKNSFPLQEKLKLPISFTRKQDESSLLLPEPLFILYKQAIGYQEAYDNKISVEILGDPTTVPLFIQKEKLSKSKANKELNKSDENISKTSSKKKHKRRNSLANSNNNPYYKTFPLKIVIKFNDHGK